MFGHWFISINWWQGGVIKTTSAIGRTPWLWLATWFLQVMPLFFFVGGFSNLVTYRSFKRKGRSTGEFLRTRAMRLLKPSLVFLIIWTAVQVALHIADVGTGTGFHIGHTAFLRGMLPPGATVPFGPLWFLGVYLVVILVAPLTIRLHDRFGAWVPVVMTLGAIVVDAFGFIGHHHAVRYVNIVFVLLLPHQLGYFYADGRLGGRDRKRTPLVMAAAGLAGLILLTNPPIFFGHGSEWFSGLRSYPKSLLGVDIEPVANTYPPTIVFVAMCYWSIGVALLLRPTISRWLERVRVWMTVIYVNSVIMTVFLWHMTAYLVALLLLWPLGLGHQHITDASWWLQRIVFEAVPGLFLVGLVVVFGRFERPRISAGTSSR